MFKMVLYFSVIYVALSWKVETTEVIYEIIEVFSYCRRNINAIMVKFILSNIKRKR